MESMKENIKEAKALQVKEYPNIDISGLFGDVGEASIHRLTARDDISLQKYGKTENALEKERLVLDEVRAEKEARRKEIAEYELAEAEARAAERRKSAKKHTSFMFYAPDRKEDEKPDRDRKNLLLMGSVIFLFCLMTAAGIILASTIISKQVAVSASNTAEKLVASINKTIEHPVDAIGDGDISDMANRAMAPTSGDMTEAGVPLAVRTAYMKAIAQYPEAVKKAAGVSWDELLAFDSMVKSVTESTNNRIIKEIFSESVTAPINYIAEGYRIWSYIMTVREKNPMDPGIALLEAASLVKYTSEYNVPLALAVGVTQTESAFRPEAISNKKACGPMQVVWDIHYRLLKNIGITKKDELFTADKGIQAGCYVLGRYLKEEKSITTGLKRYYGALSPKYINTVVSYRHTYELFSSGVDRNVALMATKEAANWSKLNAIKPPVIKASQSSAKPAVKQAAKPMPDAVQPPAAMTIYKNTGMISIKKPDGTVIEKKLDEDR